MSSGDSQTEPKKRSRRFYLVLAVISLAVIIGAILLYYVDRSYGPGPVEIEVTTDKPFYLQGEEVQFYIYVNNEQDWKVPYPDKITYTIEKDNENTQRVTMYITHPAEQIPTYLPHSRNPPLIYTWNQKGTLVPPGNYTFTVTFSGQVDYGDGGRCIFEIRAESTP